MIKFILLLPIKILGLLFIIIGSALERHEKNRIAAAREYEKQLFLLFPLSSIRNPGKYTPNSCRRKYSRSPPVRALFPFRKQSFRGGCAGCPVLGCPNR